MTIGYNKVNWVDHITEGTPVNVTVGDTVVSQGTPINASTLGAMDAAIKACSDAIDGFATVLFTGNLNAADVPLSQDPTTFDALCIGYTIGPSHYSRTVLSPTLYEWFTISEISNTTTTSTPSLNHLEIHLVEYRALNDSLGCSLDLQLGGVGGTYNIGTSSCRLNPLVYITQVVGIKWNL